MAAPNVYNDPEWEEMCRREWDREDAAKIKPSVARRRAQHSSLLVTWFPIYLLAVVAFLMVALNVRV